MTSNEEKWFAILAFCNLFCFFHLIICNFGNVDSFFSREAQILTNVCNLVVCEGSDDIFSFESAETPGPQYPDVGNRRCVTRLPYKSKMKRGEGFQKSNQLFQWKKKHDDTAKE